MDVGRHLNTFANFTTEMSKWNQTRRKNSITHFYILDRINANKSMFKENKEAAMVLYNFIKGEGAHAKLRSSENGAELTNIKNKYIMKL